MRAQITNLAIELTRDERRLASLIDFEPTSAKHQHGSWQVVGDAMLGLMQSLLKRKAIPEPRIRFFWDPEFFIGGHGRSRLQMLQENGVRGDDIFRDPNFAKYLRYFLYGPDLPRSVTDAFQQKVIDCGSPFTGSDALEVAQFARQLSRSHSLLSGEAAEEFYKLALDCGMGFYDARKVRDAVKKTR